MRTSPYPEAALVLRETMPGLYVIVSFERIGGAFTLQRLDVLKKAKSPPDKLSGAVWVMRDGVEVAVEAMTGEHLLNAFRMAIRTGHKAPALRAEILRRMEGGDRIPLPARPSADEHFDDADVYNDCIVGGCDHYGALE